MTLPLSVIESLNRVKMASGPETSAWVSANAGAGKTRLLVERVLRLLLAGTQPQRILCITYTKAAAAEMRERIHGALSLWATADEEKLKEELEKLEAAQPSAAMVKRARSLLAYVLDAPEGIRIQTIHAFCQSLLKRFPLEAGERPYFDVIDDITAAELQREAALRLFASGSTERSDALAASLHALATRLSEFGFRDMLAALTAERRVLEEWLGAAGGRAALHRAIDNALGIRATQTPAMLFEEMFAYTAQQLNELREALQILLASTKSTDKATAQALAEWLQEEGWKTPDAVASFERYAKRFITQGGTPKEAKSIFTQALSKEHLREAMLAEQDRVMEVYFRLKSMRLAALNHDVLHVAEGFLSIYQQLKRQRAVLDYDDLIVSAATLLQNPGVAPWVLYKLDGGLDHLLIDEAQDTSRQQWQIVTALTEEFFAGAGRSEITRTLFVVGDPKQSIYSFQGAEVALFHEMRELFREKINASGHSFMEVDLLASWRSSAPVLQSVDAVFSSHQAAEGVIEAGHPIRHELTRIGQEGLVELWPLISADEEEEEAPWTLPLHYRRSRSPQEKLASRIVETIAKWLEEGEMLASQKRPIRAGDIMILLRRRGTMADTLTRLLKRRGIPVAGSDRMALQENLAIGDLLALGHFLLLPEDDLNLAILLKSPIVGLSEEELFTLAYARGSASLWQRLRDMRAESVSFMQAHEWLSSFLALADYVRPYELFAHVLEVNGARSRITGRMGEEYEEALDEFLNQVLAWQQEHIPSLQAFMQWMERSRIETRRDIETGANEVRIMTVHGAKGLQAPIVFLPDTVDTPRPQGAGANLLLAGSAHVWQPAVPLWSGAEFSDVPLIAALKDARRTQDFQEYRRLLYVAMTRAEDRLYICGWRGKNAASLDSWHALARDGIAAHPDTETVETPAGEGLRLSAVQSAAADRASRQASPAIRAEPLPPALRVHVPQEEADAVVAPSRLLVDDEEEMRRSLPPGVQLFQRGLLVHRLLQYLPGIPEARRPLAAQRMLARHAPQMTEAEADALADEVMRIITHPEFYHVFAEGAMAEVPVAGTLTIRGQKVKVAGQIDRLCIGRHEIWIVDFKTDRKVPKTVNNVPVKYQRQLEAYRTLVSRIYPGRPIHCALLWTSAPSLMPVMAEEQLLVTA